MYNKKWYQKLNKSPYTPPGWVFSIVWLLLYSFLILSFYLIWKNKKCYPYCDSLNFFLLQLMLNLSWTTFFFRYKKVKLSFLLLIIIFVLSFITFYKFSKINILASYLLIPYLLWLLFAMYLNMYIIFKNKNI